MMEPRTSRGYSDVLYQVQALAHVVFPRPAMRDNSYSFMQAIYRQAGIEVPVGEEPTLSQLYIVEGWLLDKLQEMHLITERMLG